MAAQPLSTWIMRLVVYLSTHKDFQSTSVDQKASFPTSTRRSFQFLRVWNLFFSFFEYLLLYSFLPSVICTMRLRYVSLSCAVFAIPFAFQYATGSHAKGPNLQDQYFRPHPNLKIRAPEDEPPRDPGTFTNPDDFSKHRVWSLKIRCKY